MTYTDIITASFISSSITGTIGFFAQRHFKKKDDVKNKRNDHIIKDTIKNEDLLFNHFNNVFQMVSPSSSDLVTAANNINTIRRNNRLYIGDKIYYMCEEIANYLLAASTESRLIDKQKEQQFIHKFKDEFSK